jgi:hypothetical protein
MNFVVVNSTIVLVISIMYSSVAAEIVMMGDQGVAIAILSLLALPLLFHLLYLLLHFEQMIPMHFFIIYIEFIILISVFVFIFDITGTLRKYSVIGEVK